MKKENRKETKSKSVQKHFRKTFRNDDNGGNIFRYIFFSLMLHGHNLEVRYSLKILYIYYLEMWRNRKASNENAFFAVINKFRTRNVRLASFSLKIKGWRLLYKYRIKCTRWELEQCLFVWFRSCRALQQTILISKANTPSISLFFSVRKIRIKWIVNKREAYHRLKR